MEKVKRLLSLFLIFFKIGLFTFGGGYAMIAVISKELVERKKWITEEEYLNIIGIAESTPGPIAINTATFVGYNRSGVLGSVFATLGVIMPSFIIIFAISLFFEQFMALKYVQYAFKGIEACVAFLILSAGIKMFVGIKKNAFNIILFILTVAVMICFDLLSIEFSSIYYILIGGLVGIVAYLIMKLTDKDKTELPKEKD